MKKQQITRMLGGGIVIMGFVFAVARAMAADPVATPVPEPGIISLMVVAGAALSLVYRNRRK
jgi:hypothetical protein